MSQMLIAGLAVAGFLIFMLGYGIGWHQRERFRARRLAIGAAFDLADPEAYRRAYRAELERAGLDNIEERMRRFEA